MHADCGPRTWIKNSNRGSIKASHASQPRTKTSAESQPQHHALEHTADPLDPIRPELLRSEKMKPFCTVLEKRSGEVVGAELTCSLREENKAQKESYSADWHSVHLKTQPEDR